jgi:cytochrome c oxidase assembly protein subunit 11
MRRNGRLALICAAVFAGMIALAYASVPLYRAFCQATGFYGTVRRSAADAPPAVSPVTVVVRFDTNVRGMDWRFEPVEASQTVHLGAHNLAFFRATNLGARPVTGRAVFNILPEAAGPYFSKIQCFCFNNQTIGPGETVQFPVVYVVAPAYAKDRDVASSGEIILSYTFLPAAGGGAPSAGKPASPMAKSRA